MLASEHLMEVSTVAYNISNNMTNVDVFFFFFFVLV